MSRVYKKVLGLFGLALVIGTTAVAAGLPSTPDASAASSDVNVSFTVRDAKPRLSITSPSDQSVHYDNATVSMGMDYAYLTGITTTITGPNGFSALYTEVPGATDSGSFTYPLVLNDYGDYQITVTGLDENGDPVDPISSGFKYHAITVSDNGNGNIHVDYGPATCGLSFQVYDINDTAKTNPLLNPPYVVNNLTLLPGHPDFADIEIPDFTFLGASDFRVVVTALACLDGSGLEDAETTTEGVIEPPKTGALNILGLTISHVDYLVAGLISFVAIALFAIFLSRRKKERR